MTKTKDELLAPPELPKPYLSKNYPYMRQGDGPALFTADQMRAFAETALRAQAEEVERLRADAERWRALQGIADSVRGWVAFKFDDTEETTYSAEQLAAAIDAHLAASKQEKPHG